MLYRFYYEASGEEMGYLIRCARIRKIAVSSLVRRVVEAAVRDQMFQAILDDDYSKPKYCQPYHGPAYGEPTS